MAQNVPKTTKQWTVTSQDGKDGFNALKLPEEQLSELGDSQVLVKRKAICRLNEVIGGLISANSVCPKSTLRRSM